MKTKQQYLLCIAFIILSAGCIKSEEKKDTVEEKVDKGYKCSIQPGETIVEEKQIQGKKFTKKKNEQIKVCLLIQDSCLKDGSLKTEITNNTSDTISYINSLFSFYKKSDDSWFPLIYPDNYVRNDIGYLIPPQRSIQIKFFIPPQKEFSKGEYKLYLLFYSTSGNTYYCIDKFFFYTTTEPINANQ